MNHKTQWFEHLPKHIHSGRVIVNIATYLAVRIFNEGFDNILKMMVTMRIKIGSAVQKLAASQDEIQIVRSELQVTKVTNKLSSSRGKSRKGSCLWGGGRSTLWSRNYWLLNVSYKIFKDIFIKYTFIYCWNDIDNLIFYIFFWSSKIFF